jgi:alginate O-acetyltransferase complex protein AlgJ
VVHPAANLSIDVCQGKDGWLFLAGPLVALYAEPAPAAPDEKLDEWLRVIETRAARLEKLGIQYVHMPAPEKLTIYDDKLDAAIVDWRLSPALRLGRVLQHSAYAHVWLDLIHPFRAARGHRQLYAKTDSHWNAEGAFMAYQALCQRIGLTPDHDLLSRKHTDYHAVCDLGARLNPPVGEWFKMYDFTRDSRRWYRNSIASHLEAITDTPATFGGSHVAFKNITPSAAKKKILLFGDSFCSQRADSLTGMLAETAAEVEFVWSLDLDWHYIERARPDVVVYELAERNMTYVPKDDFSLRRLFWKRGLKAKWHQIQMRKPRAAPVPQLTAETESAGTG